MLAELNYFHSLPSIKDVEDPSAISEKIHPGPLTLCLLPPGLCRGCTQGLECTLSFVSFKAQVKKHLWNAYYVPGKVLSPGHTNTSKKNSPARGVL